MWVFVLALALLYPLAAKANENDNVTARARRYLVELIRLDTTNPPGNEKRAAQYLKRVAEGEGIPCETIGGDPARLNFIARLQGTGAHRPLLLMAHSDVVPADRSQWTVDPFSAQIREGYIYGRGTQDDKSVLAAELAVLVELKRRAVQLDRDVILMSEADEEAGGNGIVWLIRNAWDKIDAEFAINEGGWAMASPSGKRILQIQTSEKIPTQISLTAKGIAAHGSLPRPDNPVVRLARAITLLADADQPVRLNTTTRRYFSQLSKLEGYEWLIPFLPKLENSRTAAAAAKDIRARDPELDAMLHTSVSPTMLKAGMKINVIPNLAEAKVDVRRLPDETREEVMARLRRIVQDNGVEISPEPGHQMPATEPSSTSSLLYRKMEEIFRQTYPDGVIVPFMVRGATDGSYLRQKGMAVYGAPLFFYENNEMRFHGNDERISLKNLETGTNLLWEIVLGVVH